MVRRAPSCSGLVLPVVVLGGVAGTVEGQVDAGYPHATGEVQLARRGVVLVPVLAVGRIAGIQIDCQIACLAGPGQPRAGTGDGGRIGVGQWRGAEQQRGKQQMRSFHWLAPVVEEGTSSASNSGPGATQRACAPYWPCASGVSRMA
ncbi:hypothetical protein G6F61_014213 [Rhizopus arrhizus]|nr:hypothetical protein G6F61_014213 [Rhizopus arrhizus]